jgi:histidinol phosphatase-like PHP family hydrolase
MYIVTPVYKGHSRDPEIVPFVSSCPLYTGQNYIHCSLIRKKRHLFIDSDMWTKQDIPFVYGKKQKILSVWQKKKVTVAKKKKHVKRCG